MGPDSARDIAEVPALEIVSTAALHLMSAAAVNLGLAEDLPEHRDLDEARTLIEALAGLVTAGAPLIHELFPSSLNAQGVSSLREFAALLAAWTLAALLVNFLLPAMFALGRARLVNWLAVPLLALHIAVTAVGSRLWGVEGAVAACWIAPACFGAVLLAMGGDGAGRALAREMGGDALRFIALAAAAYGIAEVIGTSVASGLAAAVLTGLLGSALYGAGLLLVARRQVLVLVHTLRPVKA
jgi:hypothetical protein